MTDDDLSLEAVLAGDEPDEATGETETAEAETEVSRETEAATETESETATPAESETEVESDPQVPLKAYTSEREKRQAAERERDELRQQLQSRETEEKPKTSVFEDEAKWGEERDADVQLKLDNQRFNMSHALAVRQLGADKVEEAMTAFKDLAKADRELARQVNDSDLPYFEMIDIVERHAKAQELDNIDDFREKVRAEERAKLEKELDEKAEAEDKKREGLTPSLASARSTGSGTETTEPTLESAEEVFGQ